MSRLVNDNALELLKERGMVFPSRTAKDDKEFFVLLKTKLLSDIQNMDTAPNIERKIDCMVDAYLDIREYLNFMDGILQPNDSIANRIKARKDKTGEFKKRIVIDEPLREEIKRETATEIKTVNKDYTAEVKEIMDWGEANGYPSLNVGRNEKDQVYAWTHSGKSTYEVQCSQSKNGQPDEDHFLRFLEAVRRKDIRNEEAVGTQ